MTTATERKAELEAKAKADDLTPMERGELRALGGAETASAEETERRAKLEAGRQRAHDEHAQALPPGGYYAEAARDAADHNPELRQWRGDDQ
jgi:hypothetical protein